MPYKDFFRINLPYGMRKNSKNEWLFFNREAMPLGFNIENNTNYGCDKGFLQYPIYTKYNLLTEKTLLKLAHNRETGIKKNDKGEIEVVYFYNDRTNPQSNSQYWDEYFEKIKLLSKCEVKID